MCDHEVLTAREPPCPVRPSFSAVATCRVTTCTEHMRPQGCSADYVCRIPLVTTSTTTTITTALPLC